MPTGTSLERAALDPVEREVLDRLVRHVEAEYGDDLHGIWLYGSRARGERTHDESDVDVMVVTRTRRRDDRVWRFVTEGWDLGVFVDPRQVSLEWVEGRRAIRSFFLQEVDRDKIVLLGEP